MSCLIPKEEQMVTDLQVNKDLKMWMQINWTTWP